MTKDNFLYKIAGILLTGLLAAMIILMGGCKSIRKVQKDKTHIDSTGQRNVSFVIETETTRKSTVPYELPGEMIQGQVLPCDTAEQVIESNGIKTSYQYNPQTGKSTIKTQTPAKTIQIPVDETTRTKETSNESTTAAVVKYSESKNKDMQKTGFYLAWYWWMIIILAICVCLFIWGKRLLNKAKNL